MINRFQIKALLMLAAPFLLAPGANAQSASGEGELLVRWASQSAPRVLAPGQNARQWQLQSLSARLSAALPGARVGRSFAGSGWSVVRVPPAQSVGEARARLVQTLGAANVAINARRHIAKVPNDPDYAAQWQWPQIKAPAAWDKKTGSSSVVVAVLDTGVDLAHADLKANLWKNSKEIAGNGVDDDGNGVVDDVYGLNAVNEALPPQDDNGHGTHVAGLIGAVGNNKTGASGTCWSVKIMALKFLDAAGAGTDADAIQCLEYAVKMKRSGVNLKIVSNSWSGDSDNPALLAAFQLAQDAGLLSVCAAGNGTNSNSIGKNNDTLPEYPASYALSSIVSVAASDSSDARPLFSNYGAKSVDLAAPGTAITSLKLGGGTTAESGTSMATPIVAGAAALLSAKESALSATEIKTRLLATVDAVAAWKGKSVSGGRLNLERTLTNATLRISGQVYALKGTTKVTLAGARLKIGSKVLTSSDRNGNYVLPDIAPGSYSLSATLSGYSFPSIALKMTSSRTGVNLVAKSAPSTAYTLSGVATNADGAPQKGVSIFIDGTPQAVALTDAAGKYAIRNRAAGTYKLSAQSDGLSWSASPASLSLPVKSGTGAPNGVVNFAASVPDTTAPSVSIAAPADGAALASGSFTATGNASDPAGVTKLSFLLTRVVGSTYSYYDWSNGTWTTDASAAGVTGTQTASGTSLNWSQPLPDLSAGRYSLRVWGTDALGNESTGEADALTSWTVSGATSSRSTSSSSGSS